MKDLILKLAKLIGVSELLAWFILGAAALFLVAVVIVTILVCLKNARIRKAQETLSKEAEKEFATTNEVVEETNTPKPQENSVTEEVIVIKEKTAQPKVNKPKTTAKKPSAPKKEQKPEPKKESKKLNGKWVVVKKRDNEFVAQLMASNGEIMLNSEVYSSFEGAKSGISTIQKGVVEGKFVVYNDKDGDNYFKLKSSGNKLLCAGEIYKTKEGCLSAIESVKRIAKDSPISDVVVEGQRFIDYTPKKIDLETLKGAKGKWKIEQDQNGYFARLYANNGQVMLSTESVSQKSTALKAIESVKKNAELGNFIIDKDKFGRFYYKLRNVQKSVICIGEAYDTLDRCVSALESVRKFALNSLIVE